MRTLTDRWVPGLSFWGCLLYAVICVYEINFILEASVSCDIDDKYGSMVCQRVCATMCVRRRVCLRFDRKGDYPLTVRFSHMNQSIYLNQFGYFRQAF